MDTSEPQVASEAAQPLRIYPPVLALALFAGTLLLHLMLPEARAVRWHHALGLLVVASGIGLTFFAAGIFQGRETTKNPYGEPAAFVVQAPYTFTRNPMYLGSAVALLGMAIFFDSIVMLLAPAVFFSVIDRMVIPREEAAMERRFGQQYRDYTARVRRWL